jgi:hypothetical protein
MTENEKYDITRNISLDRETDQAILDKQAEMMKVGGRGHNYSAAVREYVRECGILKDQRDTLLEAAKAALGPFDMDPRDCPADLSDDPCECGFHRAYDKLRAAIAKCEGNRPQ